MELWLVKYIFVTSSLTIYNEKVFCGFYAANIST